MVSTIAYGTTIPHRLLSNPLQTPHFTQRERVRALQCSSTELNVHFSGLCIGSVENILRGEMKWDIWLSAIRHVFLSPHPHTDLFNKPYEKSPVQK